MADHAPARTKGGTMTIVLTIMLVGCFTMLGLAKVVGAAGMPARAAHLRNGDGPRGIGPAVAMAAGRVSYLVPVTAAIV